MLRRRFSSNFPLLPILAVMLLMLADMLLMLAGSSLSAQDAPNTGWRVWLYSPLDGSIRIADQNGGIIDGYRLPLSQAFNAYGESVSVSATGRYIAYSAYDSTSESGSRQLFVYDHILQTTRFGYDISGADALSFDYLPTALAFDEPGERFAFAWLDEAQSWRIIVADLTTGTAQAVGEATSAPELVEYAISHVPVIQQLGGTRVTFTLLPYGTEYRPEYPAFTWDFLAAEVDAEPGYNSLVTDAISGGPRVIARFDASLPAAELTGDVPRLELNLFEVVNQRGERQWQYNETEGTIEQVKLIENGQRVLAQVYAYAGDERVLKVIGPDGSIAAELLGTLSDIHGTPDGFVGLFDNGGVPAMAYVNTAEETPSLAVIWSADSAIPLQLVRVAG